MKLLVDADYIVYKSCAGAESEIDWGDDVIVVTSKFSEAYNNTKREIKKIENAFFSSTDTILFFSDSVNAMGIYATLYPGNTIVSPDKDMRQIPGNLYDLNEVTVVTPEEGYRWHMVQTLAGDQTDGYGGVPGIGVKRAISLFETHGYTWKTVLSAFKEKDLDEDVALQNARLAKILTIDNYDLEQRRPILWTPSNASHGTDDGARVHVTTNS